MKNTEISATKIVIKKNQGLTQALEQFVKKKSNSILSDGKITSKEWHRTMMN